MKAIATLHCRRAKVSSKLDGGRGSTFRNPLHFLSPMLSRLAFAFSPLVLTTVVHAASIWVEGESPTKSSVMKHNWYDGVKRDVLSGNNWLSHYGDKPGEASYEIEVPEAGNYTFFARLNP